MRIFALLALIPVIMAGCALDKEGALTPNRVQVKEQKMVHEVDLQDVNENYIRGVAGHYRKHGDGPVNLTVTYDPTSRTNTAMTARQAGKRIAAHLNHHGVQNVATDVMPVAGSENDAMALMTYTSYTAHRPDGCDELMPGTENTKTGSGMADYKLGCTMDAMVARQVSRPKDLLGQGAGETSDGRRGSNLVEIYRSGAPNESLEGESASGE